MYNDYNLGIDEDTQVFIGIWSNRPVGFIWAEEGEHEDSTCN